MKQITTEIKLDNTPNMCINKVDLCRVKTNLFQSNQSQYLTFWKDNSTKQLFVGWNCFKLF